MAFIALVRPTNVVPLNINIVTALPYNVGVAVDIVRTGAAFDIAVEEVNRKYREDGLNITVTYLYNGLDRTCDVVSSRTAQLVGEYHYRHGQEQLNTCFSLVATAGTLYYAIYFVECDGGIRIIEWSV